MAKVPEAYLEARKQEILDAAMRSFVHRGIEGATMQEIASECDCSAGALYRYFPSKEALAHAVFAMCEQEHRELLATAAAESASSLDTLTAVGEAVSQELASEGAQDVAVMRLESALAAARDPQGLGLHLARVTAGLIEGLEGLIDGARHEGDIPASVDAHQLAVLLMAVEAGLNMLVAARPGEIDPRGVFDQLTRLLNGRAAALQEDG